MCVRVCVCVCVCVCVRDCVCVWHYDHIAILPHGSLMNLEAVTVNKTELKRGGCIKTILPNLYNGK